MKKVNLKKPLNIRGIYRVYSCFFNILILDVETKTS